MKEQIPITLLLTFMAIHVSAQIGIDSLFDIKEPLAVKLTLTIKEVRKSKEDTIYLSHQLYYRNLLGAYDSIRVGLKGRGNFRLQQCYFPPLSIKMEKKNAKGTLFEGNKKLKLVLPCNGQSGSNALILREYLCYKLYEEVTPYAFKTRLINIDLTEQRGKNKKTYKQKGIFIEDLNKVAKRFHAKPASEARLNAALLHDTSALRFDLFQFMISNTDWSKVFQHNTKVLYQEPNYVAIPYDFDMAGLVDAPYAVVSQIGGEQLPIESVRERFYRGYCMPQELTEFVRKEFLAKEEKFMFLPDELKGELPDREIKGIKNYLQDFFIILKTDYLFRSQVLNNCLSIK